MPEEANTPARAMLIEIPSRRELCVRNIFHVADCKLYWQRNGDHLCVKVDRYSKAKKADEKDQMKYSVRSGAVSSHYVPCPRLPLFNVTFCPFCVDVVYWCVCVCDLSDVVCVTVYT